MSPCFVLENLAKEELMAGKIQPDTYTKHKSEITKQLYLLDNRYERRNDCTVV